MKTLFFKMLMVVTLMLTSILYVGCTDLKEEVFSQITPEQFFKTDTEALAALVPIYAQLRDYLWNYYNIQQHTSDETMVPQRGGDWGDGGTWAALHTHKWDKTHPNLNEFWGSAFSGISRANIFLDNLAKASTDESIKKQFAAEAKFLRAFYYYTLMDFFGGVPINNSIVTKIADYVPQPRNTRAEVFSFVESELKTILADLPAKTSSENFGRITKGAANTLLARLYLNAQVYTGTARYQEAIAACDAVINSGAYGLTTNYFDNFKVDNQDSREAIFVIGNLANGGLGLTFTMRNFHYNQIPQSPWNGFCTIAEYYNSFDRTNDTRAKIFQAGQAVNLATGAPVNDRQGNPLIFTEAVPLTNAGEGDGIRVLKWAYDPNQNSGEAGNDYFILRYADVLLMKAEAINELSGPTAEALALVNQIRARVFSPARPVNFTDKAAFKAHILKERGFELGWEATRRTDLIRHGKFQDAWTNKGVSESFRNIFPIPQRQIDANPRLTQNPNY